MKINNICLLFAVALSTNVARGEYVSIKNCTQGIDGDNLSLRIIEDEAGVSDQVVDVSERRRVINEIAANASFIIMGEGKYGGFKASSFIIKDNVFVTNYHVIRGATELKVYKFIAGCNDSDRTKCMTKIADSSVNKIDIINADVIRDIAIFKVENLKSNGLIARLKVSNGETHSDAKVTDELIIVSNPGSLFGYWGRTDLGLVQTSYHLTNEGFLRPLVDSRYDYNLMYFEKIINPGSSGAAILDWPCGYVVGIAGGGTGNEFAGFGIPVKYLRELLSEKDSYKEVSGFKDRISLFGSQEKKEDPYYSKVKTFSSKVDQKITIKGKVIEINGPALEGVTLKVYRKEKNTGHIQKIYSSVSSFGGRFEFDLPYRHKYEYLVDGVRFGYEMPEQKLYSIRVGQPQEVKMRKLKQTTSNFLEVSEHTVELDRLRKEIYIYLKKATGEGIDNEESSSIKFKICREESGCNDEENSWVRVPKMVKNSAAGAAIDITCRVGGPELNTKKSCAEALSLENPPRAYYEVKVDDEAFRALRESFEVFPHEALTTKEITILSLKENNDSLNEGGVKLSVKLIVNGKNIPVVTSGRPQGGRKLTYRIPAEFKDVENVKVKYKLLHSDKYAFYKDAVIEGEPENVVIKDIDDNELKFIKKASR